MCGVQCPISPSTVCAASGRGDWGLKWACNKAEGTRINLFPLRFRQINHLLNAWTSKSRYTTTGGRNLFVRFCFVECTSPVPRLSRNEKRISSALELARKITMYNSRYKTAGIIAQETEFQPSPLLRPRTPVQPYPFFPWQPKGDCLSSTEV